jgi:hypothetical protein
VFVVMPFSYSTGPCVIAFFFLLVFQLRLLWNWIPERLTVYSPSLVFTSLEHGTSLNTLYSVLDNLEHCFIVIKTFENEVIAFRLRSVRRQEKKGFFTIFIEISKVFGAFCSGLWSERKTQKSKYFGNGETFLFTLVPHVKIYKWVGANTDTRAISQELFIRANNVQIAIGGGYVDPYRLIYQFKKKNLFCFSVAMTAY